MRRTLDRFEEDKNKGRMPGRGNKRERQGGIDEDSLRHMGKSGGHGHDDQHKENMRRNSAQDPPEKQAPIYYPNFLS